MKIIIRRRIQREASENRHFRVDRMKEVSILTADAVERPADFNLPELLVRYLICMTVHGNGHPALQKRYDELYH